MGCCSTSGSIYLPGFFKHGNDWQWAIPHECSMILPLKQSNPQEFGILNCHVWLPEGICFILPGLTKKNLDLDNPWQSLIWVCLKLVVYPPNWPFECEHVSVFPTCGELIGRFHWKVGSPFPTDLNRCRLEIPTPGMWEYCWNNTSNNS